MKSDAIGHKALILADETDLTIFIKLITNSEKKKGVLAVLGRESWPGIIIIGRKGVLCVILIMLFLVICT
jgi:hypothetical protein